MSADVWGMDEHGEPVTPEFAAHQIIEAEIRRYIDLAARMTAAGNHDEATLKEMRWLHLAEPWLPASAALKAMREAGLIVRDATDDRSQP